MFRLPNAEERACPEDRCALDLSQPDGSKPGALLGVCPRCGEWYVLVLVGHPAVWKKLARLRASERLLPAGSGSS